MYTKMLNDKFIREITKLSDSQYWDSIMLEWELEQIYENNEPITCLCGYSSVVEICILKNKINKNFVIVGNCCVKNFIGLRSRRLFRGFKRIREEISKSATMETIQYCYDNDWIDEIAFNFYVDIIRKKRLSEAQLKWKMRINKIILNQFNNSSIETCPQCGSPLKIRVPKPNQDWKSFWGCSKYPYCKYSRNLQPPAV